MDTNTDKKLDAILDAIKGLDDRITKIEAGTTGAVGNKASVRAPAKKQSIKEFLLEHAPATDIQRTLAIGYFLENQAGMASFSRPDLEKGYRDAKETLPSNISVNINHCIKQGHMMEAHEKKNNKTAYVITRSGETFVASGYKKPGSK
jgi:hypothetical protein